MDLVIMVALEEGGRNIVVMATVANYRNIAEVGNVEDKCDGG